MIGTKWANSPPATPAKNEEMTNARTLYPVVFTPIASAATSSSRIAQRLRPWVLPTMRRATSTTRNTQNQTAKRPEVQGCPERPSARPNTSRFWTMTRMISPKPSVTMAR